MNMADVVGHPDQFLSGLQRDVKSGVDLMEDDTLLIVQFGMLFINWEQYLSKFNI